ncbi:universal stress protein [Actinoplanes sp. NPDC051411]|uniref:universal stress protein n=1 Tax=Actinoplanes sp. NPDC051411 TaxID=3155522 RepID=UPI003418CAF5
MSDDDLPLRASDVCRDGPRAIVVGVDGSVSSMRAAAYAAGLARRQHCRLVAVFVRSLPALLMPMADTSGSAAATVAQAHDAVEKELRDAIAERSPALNLDVHLVVRTGEPFTELLEVAQEVRADAVIVGRSTKMLHRIAGSLAIKLVRAGRWPVTVVP